MANTLTKIDFWDIRKGTPDGGGTELLTVLFEPKAYGFAIGALRSIRNWTANGTIVERQQLHVIREVSVSMEDGATIYTVVAPEVNGGHVLVLTGRVRPEGPQPDSTYRLREQLATGRDPRIERAMTVLEGGPQRDDEFLDQIQDARVLISAAHLIEVDSWIMQTLDL